MHHYPFHLGDYAVSTAHLSCMEDLAYRRLLDLYYRTEAPIPLDAQRAARLIRMAEHADAVAAVLAEFFTPSDSGHTHSRCDREIAAYAERADQARKNGALGGRPRNPVGTKSEPTRNPGITDPVILANQDLTGLKANQEPEPITNNQEPIKDKEPRKKRGAAAQLVGIEQLVAEGVDKTHAADWLAVRKEKRLPLTQTCWEAVKDEAQKAGITPAEAVKVSAERPWAGFKASWLAEKQSPGGVVASPNLNRQEALEARNRAVADRWLASMGAA